MEKTYVVKQEDVQADWYVVDAAGQTLGRLATQVARLLSGKHKPAYSPAVDGGDFVVVVNARQVRTTGRKLDQKMYHRYSGYPGGLRTTSLRTMLEKHPARVIVQAVRGMLPKNRLGRRMLRKLKVYDGPEHPHGAQQPQRLELS